MTDLEILEDIRLAVLYIQYKANSVDPEVLREAEREYEYLVDRFYGAFPRFMTSRQSQAARNNYEYFLFFIDRALAHSREQAGESKGGS